mgnify:FL=1
MNYRDLDDKELLQKMDKSALADKLKNDEAFQLLREAGDRIAERAIADFVFKVPLDDLQGLASLKAIIRKYKYELFAEIEAIAMEGDILFEEIKGRDLF